MFYYEFKKKDAIININISLMCYGVMVITKGFLIYIPVFNSCVDNESL